MLEIYHHDIITPHSNSTSSALMMRLPLLLMLAHAQDPAAAPAGDPSQPSVYRVECHHRLAGHPCDRAAAHCQAHHHPGAVESSGV